MCDRVEFKRRRRAAASTPIDAAVVLQFFPAEPFTAPGTPRQAMASRSSCSKRPVEEAPTDGRVRLRTDTIGRGPRGRPGGRRPGRRRRGRTRTWSAAIQTSRGRAGLRSSTRSRKDSSSPCRRPRSSRSRPTRWSRSTRTCTPVRSWGDKVATMLEAPDARDRRRTDGDLLHHLPGPVAERMSGSPAASTSAMRTSARRLSMSSRDSARAARSRPRSMVGPTIEVVSGG